ncbi:MAG TPA: hypothetical protein VJ204_10860, partial [Solirubrobacterales bacterium]|nr:hypothetical protein [Solirubrobacterales bacterium]
AVKERLMQRSRRTCDIDLSSGQCEYAQIPKIDRDETVRAFLHDVDIDGRIRLLAIPDGP